MQSVHHRPASPQPQARPYEPLQPAPIQSMHSLHPRALSPPPQALPFGGFGSHHWEPSLAKTLSKERALSAPPAGADSAIARDWRESTAVLDRMLHGPLDPHCLEPGRVRCRQCTQPLLLGNLVGDEMAVANHRLVSAMDFAWAVTERLYHQKAALEQKNFEVASKAANMRDMVNSLRSEFPGEVHGLVMRSLAEQNSKLERLREEVKILRELQDSPVFNQKVQQATEWELPKIAPKAMGPIDDEDWLRFRDTITHRANLALGEPRPLVKQRPVPVQKR